MNDNKPNIDVLIYVNNLVTELRNTGIFEEPQHVMLDADRLEEVLLRISNENLAECGDPEVSEEQLYTAMRETVDIIIGETIASLYDKGLLEMGGITPNGSCTYFATPMGNEVYKEVLKSKETNIK